MKRSRLKSLGTRGSVHARLHALWREVVLRRDGRRCQRCNGNVILQAHHVVPKGKRPKMRYLIENGLTLCVACHFWIEKVALDRERAEFLERAIGAERIAELDLISRDQSPSRVDLRATEIWLRRQISK